MSANLKNHIVVSGAKGFVGKNLKKFLARKDLTQISLSRNNFQDNKFPSLKKASIFVHLVGIGSESFDEKFQQVNVEITKTAIKLCKKNNIKKIIYLSGLGVSKNSCSSYFISKFNAEQLIKKSGLDYTIFRPSYIIGDDDYLTKNVSKQFSKKRIIIPGSGKFVIQPIFINDVCSCLDIAFYFRKFSNKTIDLVGPTKITFLKLIQNSKPSNVKLEKIQLELAYKKALNYKNFEYGIEDLNILVGNYTGNHKKLQNLCKFTFKKIKSLNT